MLDFIIKRYIGKYDDIKRPSVRKAYGNLAGTIGIVINLILSAIKITVGYMSGSIAIMSDGFHNLVDVISAAASILSFKLSGREPDWEHPYGHGRIEYIFSIGVSLIVFVVGIQFFIESFQKILHPEPIVMTSWGFALLGVSLLGTLTIWYTYKKIGKIIDSSMLQASGVECMADIIVTLVIIVGIVISATTGRHLDGYLGIFASLVICHTGYSIFKESTSQLIGEEPSPALVNEINRFVRSYEGVMGVHDLMIHDYGPSHKFATIHVEVDANNGIVESHELIDRIEKEAEEALHIKLTIHMDPLVRDETVIETYKAIDELVRNYDENFSIHDLRIVSGHDKLHLFFDLVVPFNYKKKHSLIRKEISDLIYDYDTAYEAVITIDVCYTGLTNVHEQK